MMSIRNMFFAVMVSFTLSILAFAQSQNQVDIDPFFTTLDINKDGSIGKGEWKEMGLMDLSFSLCDPNKNDSITKQEMSACAITSPSAGTWALSTGSWCGISGFCPYSNI